MQFFYTIVYKKCIESTGKKENAIFTTVIEVHPFKVKQKTH